MKAHYRVFLLQFLKFGLVGGINTGISVGVYYLLIFFSVNYMVANTVGYLCSLAVGYLLSRFWVFQASATDVKKTAIKYAIIYGSALLINLGSMYLWVDVLFINKNIAPLLTLCITIPYNFIFSRVWAFREMGNED